MIIRKKEYKDCEAWVDVNISSWCDNLKKVVSSKVLDYIKNSRDSRIKKDKDNFIIDEDKYVLEDNNRVIGILKIKQSNRVDYEDCGEVQVLYLYSEEKGKGYGKLLINKAFEILKSRGYKKVVIGCLKDNPANEFYKHIGGKFIREDIWDILDEQYLENVYEYEL